MTLMPCVLMVDQDSQSCGPLLAALAQDGYDVRCANNLAEAEACLAQGPVALVLLDAQLPNCDALALTREWRQRSERGIILIGAAGTEGERLAALDSGADEYLLEPINPRELLLRIRNLLRRVQQALPLAQSASHLKRFADWTLDTDRRRLKACDGRETLLSHGEFQLLNVFMRNSGHTLSRDQLMDQLRNREWLPNDRSIDVLVGRLRRKLHDDPAEPELIITIHGAGYLFTAGASIAA